jgi:hypothetical protein
MAKQDKDQANHNGHEDGKVVELRAGQKEKVTEHRPPAEAPRTWDAPEVRELAEGLIASGLPHMSALRPPIGIAYVFSNAEREGDRNNLAKAQRFNATYSFLYERHGRAPEFLLRVSKPQWDRVPDDLKPQALYHYLLWFGTDTMGRPRIEQPDVVAFGAEIEVFKGQPRWNEGLRKARQLGLFDGLASAEVVEEVAPAQR